MSGYIAPLLWSFVPGQITTAVLPTLTSLVPGLLPPAPRGSPAYQRNYRLVLTALILGWVAWAVGSEVFGATSAGSGDAYVRLGVPFGAGDDELRRAFRHLSRTYHPDRLGPHPPPEAEAQFIAIRQAYEVLMDPVKRFAYDRFGPAILSWTKIENTREYISHGSQTAAAFYAMSVGIMLLLALLGRAGAGAYWRNILLGAAVILEATLVLAPTPAPTASPALAPVLAFLPRAIAKAVAPLLPAALLRRPAYMHIRVIRRLYADATVAISQLAGVWATQDETRRAIHAVAAAINADAVQDLADEVGPVLGLSNDVLAVERNLVDRMEHVLLDRALMNHPAVGPYWAAAAQQAQGAGTAAVHMDASGSGHIHPTARGPGIQPASAQHLPQVRNEGVVEELTVAANLPLPPSRAPSPPPPQVAGLVPEKKRSEKDARARRRSPRLSAQ